MKLTWHDEQLIDFLTTAKLRHALAEREQELVELRLRFPSAPQMELTNKANAARISRAQLRLLAKHLLLAGPGKIIAP